MALDNPMEYASLVLTGEMQDWTDAESSKNISGMRELCMVQWEVKNLNLTEENA